jgi:hypothetical protein
MSFPMGVVVEIPLQIELSFDVPLPGHQSHASHCHRTAARRP